MCTHHTRATACANERACAHTTRAHVHVQMKVHVHIPHARKRTHAGAWDLEREALDESSDVWGGLCGRVVLSGGVVGW